MTVFVIGSINQDIVVTSGSHMRPGETLTGNELAYYPGGKGANQAIAATRAGAAVSMIGCIGDDASGQELKAFLEDAGVDTALVSTVEGVATGAALIVVSGGENAIVVVSGANQHVGLGSVDAVQFSESDYVMAQFETPLGTTAAAFEAAKRAGARTILNPSPVKEMPPSLLQNTDVLVVNEHEFEMIFNMPLAPLLSGQAGRPDAFQGTLVITLGADGVLTFAGRERIRLESRSVKVVDSTGAGDCFVGYLAALLHDREGLPRALELANLAASVSVTQPGAASSLPWRADLPPKTQERIL